MVGLLHDFGAKEENLRKDIVLLYMQTTTFCKNKNNPPNLAKTCIS